MPLLKKVSEKNAKGKVKQTFDNINKSDENKQEFNIFKLEICAVFLKTKGRLYSI